MAKVFRSKRDGKVITLVEANEELVSYHIEGEDNEHIHTIKASSLKRWYVPVEDAEAEATSVAESEVAAAKEVSNEQLTAQETLLATPSDNSEDDKSNEPAEPVELVEPVEPAKKANSKKSVAKKNSGPNYDDVCKNFLNFTKKMAEQFGITVFNFLGQKNFYSLKVDGKIYMAFSISTRGGVNLWLRSKAVDGLCEYKRLNHMLDARVSVKEWNADIYKFVTKLHDASLKYQLNTNAKTKTKKK